MSKIKIDKRLLDPEKKPYHTPNEAEDWAAHGCANNQEWHDHLNRLMWAGNMPRLK